jgi:hypothetical protein
MNTKLSLILALVIMGIFPVASIYAWQLTKTSENTQTEFRVVVNGFRELNVLVPLNVNDGLTEEEVRLIARETFVQVMGEKVIHQLTKLTLNENSMEVRYVWGINESDMGHVFHIIGDFPSRSIIVKHCR